jgi:hypothetical protein
MGVMAADYLTHRLLHTSLPVHPRWAQIRRIAARLAFEDDEHQESYAHYVKILCHRAAEFDDPLMSQACGEDWFPECEPDEDYDYNLLAAAAYTNKCLIIEQLADRLVDYPRWYMQRIGGLFSHPHICAAVAGHDAALDLLFAKFETNKPKLISYVVDEGAEKRMVEKFVPMELVEKNRRKLFLPAWVPEKSMYSTSDVATFDMLVRVSPKQELEKSILGSVLIEAATHGWEDTLQHVLALGAPVEDEYCKLESRFNFFLPVWG